MFEKDKYKIYNEDCFEILKKLSDNSIDFILTDPPYFIDGLDDNWESNKVKNSQKKAKVIGGMPVGMKFDIKQSKDFYKFSEKIFKEYFRILKPGGFVVSFSQARLYHSQAMAAEENGFEIRDMLGWVYEGQAKAFTQEHFINKRKNLSEKEKEKIIEILEGRKTPQLKPMIEPMVLGQKPKEGTFVDNWLKYKTGLIDTSISLNDKFPGNLFKVPKPSKKEKKEYNFHPTVKPLLLLETLIKIFTTKDSIVLDPFLGSGSTLIAALNSDRKFIGSEISKDYYDIILKRLEDTVKNYKELK
jgi:site-specific DNA-methyltransferase (adenine-specific)